jgi:hypothetical protein
MRRPPEIDRLCALKSKQVSTKGGYIQLNEMKFSVAGSRLWSVKYQQAASLFHTAPAQTDDQSISQTISADNRDMQSVLAVLFKLCVTGTAISISLEIRCNEREILYLQPSNSLSRPLTFPLFNKSLISDLSTAILIVWYLTCVKSIRAKRKRRTDAGMHQSDGQTWLLQCNLLAVNGWGG